MKKQRDTNIEIFRIVLMLMIITHHMIVNSGFQLFDSLDIATASARTIRNTVIGQLCGWGGKTGINGFLLITGYYMCEQNINIKKWLKLVLEVVFYNVLINGIFLLANYYPCGVETVVKSFFSTGLLTGLDWNERYFISIFLVMYLLIPYINMVIKSCDKTMHRRLIIILGFYYVIITTVSLGTISTFESIGCYLFIYLIGAYFKKYEIRIDSLRFGIIFSALSLLAIWGYIIFSDFMKVKLGIGGGGYYPVDSENKLLAVTMAVSLFIFFKNIRVKYNKYINALASTTLGVLCIHTNGATMRQLLWNDLLHVPEMQMGPTGILLASLITIPIAIFIICALVDLIRQRLFLLFTLKQKKEKSGDVA